MRNQFKNSKAPAVLYKKIPSFPIEINWYRLGINELNIFGSHDEYVVMCYDVTVARFFVLRSAENYIKKLVDTNFAEWRNTPDGCKLLEVIYLSFEKVKLNSVDRGKIEHLDKYGNVKQVTKGIILKDINNKDFLA